MKDPDWVNDPEYKWGSEDGPAGYMETVDTGFLLRGLGFRVQGLGFRI